GLGLLRTRPRWEAGSRVLTTRGEACRRPLSLRRPDAAGHARPAAERRRRRSALGADPDPRPLLTGAAVPIHARTHRPPRHGLRQGRPPPVLTGSVS